MKSTIPTAFLGLASLAVSAPAPLDSRQMSLEQVTDNYVFSISMEEFVKNRNEKTGPVELDWKSDGCSQSPDNPLGFDFKNACNRHDFGYRNFKKQKRFNATNKDRIDSNFKTDLFNQCAKAKLLPLLKEPCRTTARLYYEAVKAFGNKRAVEMAEERRDMEE